MATYDYVEEWYRNNKDLVEKYLDDPEMILSSENGKKKGTYLVSAKLVEEDVLIPMYAGEAGADDEHDRSIADRLKEHIRIWLGNYTEYWTGLKKEELEDNRIKLHLYIVGEAEALEKRKRMETYTIQTVKPYLQYGPYMKYPSEYKGLDLCIVPWKGTRRAAFLRKLEQEGITWNEKTRIVDYIFDENFKPVWDKYAKAGKEKKEIADGKPHAYFFRGT